MLRQRHARDRAQLLITQPMAVVAETLIGLAILFELRLHLLQERDDMVARHKDLQCLVQSLALSAADEVDRVLFAASSDDADLALVGPGVAVPAAGHADADALVGQAERLQ